MTPNFDPLTRTPSPRFVDGYFPPQPSIPMAVAAADNDDRVLQLIHQLEADRKVFTKLLDTLSEALQSQPERFNPRQINTSLETDAAPSPLPWSSAAQPIPAPKRRTTSLTSHSAQSSHILEQHPHLRQPKDSIYTGDGSSDSEDDESFFAQEALPPRDFSETDLIEHLKSHPWDIYSKYIMQDLLRNIDLLSVGIFVKDRHHQSDANHQHADIYHVGTDGAPVRLARGDSLKDEGPLASWEALKSVNSNASRKQAVGRIVIVREPASSLFAALHLTMKEHFDMDSIYRILIDDHTPSKAMVKGYLKKDQRRQRSIVFVFKYHTLVGDGRAPLPWQSHDDDLDSAEDHIPLTTCSSIVGLSMHGPPAYTLRRNSRKSKSVLGSIYDPFAPWHVLSVQCFPDWNSSVDTHEHNHHYCNGPDAFLATLLSEYRDAIKRFKMVHKKIQNLATPPNRSIFDSALRDELLFENNRFTYSRRYFWASQTLGLLSNEIKDIISTYKDTFTDEFWSGEHKTLFPGTKDQSPRYNNWRKKLFHTRRQFEKEIAQLEEVFRTFQDQQKQIKNLREWLFSGTSVLESREAVSMAKITVEQGYNIRLLTLVTLFYLPLSYVTGIYGMTNMPVTDGFLPFALTTVGICVPTYLLILIVNNPEATRKLLANVGLLFTKLAAIPAPKRSNELRQKILKHKQPHHGSQSELHKSATFASLEGRLSQDLSHELSLRGSQGFIQATRRMSQSLASHLHPSGGRRASQPATEMPPRLSTYPGSPNGLGGNRQRPSTVKFEEPFSSPSSKWRTAESQVTTVHDFEKSNSNISAISPTEIPEIPDLPAFILTIPNGSPLPSAPQRTMLRPPDSRRERSLSPFGGGRGKSIFGRLGSRLSSALPSPRTSEPGTPRESV